MLELICQELGVEIGEIWEGNDGYRYKITEDGDIEFYYIASNDEEECEIDTESWVSIMNGDLRPVWKPKDGEKYFTPHFTPNPNKCFCENVWRRGRTQDEWMYDNNLAFKTREEAIDCTLEMIALAKMEYKE